MKTPKNASYKWKLSPVNLMDRARFQDWLNQMARQDSFTTGTPTRSYDSVRAASPWSGSR